ncbi:MAG TPA: crosslink repair DNA glycosylase YcaQ family protein [Candidatus Binatus sp.]|nr:crosslink repair DNA glycosylase YcaQ family protein [Candidatus Binatus sp.]
MPVIMLSRVAARRFILGRQGLWPGRRWKGKPGTERAMRAMEYLQLDPLQIVARSQDLALHSRVIDYSPATWEKLCYEERKFFDWGGWLAVRPMEELPHWRVVMRRERDDPRFGRLIFHDSYRHALSRQHREAIEEMRAVVRSKGTVSNRDFAMPTRRRVNHYRGRKDSAVALYYLWRIGELMTHHRERFERVYGLAEAIAPEPLLRESSDEEADAFLIRKTIAFHGLHRMSGGGSGDIGNPVLNRVLRRPVTAKEVARLREKMLADGEILEVQVEGYRHAHYALATDAKDLREVVAGRVPRAWRPRDTTTREEVTFLSPLDIVTARDRARALFDFDYKWEVYVPEAQRKFGYYALPILWDDAFVARSDLRLDRSTNTLVVCGIWFENRKTATDPAFHDALAKGIARLMRFIGATKLDASAVEPRSVRNSLARLRGGDRC